MIIFLNVDKRAQIGSDVIATRMRCNAPVILGAPAQHTDEN